MNKITNFLWSCILLMCTIFFVSNEVRGQLLTEQFNYTSTGTLAGDSIIKISGTTTGVNGNAVWKGHNGYSANVPTNPQLQTATSLTYATYPTLGGAASFTTTGLDINATFASQNTAGTSVYSSFILNLTTAQAAGDYFFNLGQTTSLAQPWNVSFFTTRVFARSSGTGFQLGFTRTTTAPTYGTTIYPFGTPIFIVVKHTFVTGTTNDIASMYIYSSGLPPNTEPTPDFNITTETGTDPTEVSKVMIRQGTATPTGQVDYIRVGTTWADVTSAPVVGATLVANPTTITDFGSINNGSNSTASSYTLTATSVTNSVIVTAPTNFQVAKTTTGTYMNSVTYTVAELATPQTVGVRFSPTSGVNGIKSGNVTHSGFSGTTVAVSGTEAGNVASPTLVANPTTIADFGSVNNAANSTASSYILTATNITNSVIITAPTNFQVAKGAGAYTNTITYTVAELSTPQTVGVRFSPISGTNGVKTGSISHSGFVGTTVAVSGTETGNVATLVANPITIADFGSVNTNANSTASSYTLTATNLTADVIVTAPTNFQVARGIAGTYGSSVTYTIAELATAQIVGVRFLPTSGVAGIKSGNVTHSGFMGTNVAVSGTETIPTPLPNYDPFNYTGTNLQTQTGWTVLNTGDDIAITSGSLAYPNLPTPIGNKISFQGAGIDAYKEFASQNANTVYSSFLIRVTDLTSITTAAGGYSLAFIQGASTGAFGATFWTKVDGAGYQIGINPRTTVANTVFTTGTPLVVNTTYMVVISYTFNANTGDDVVKLWLNPTLGVTEPTSTLQQTNTGGTDLASVGRFLIRQGTATDTPAQDIDELRIGTTWADVTPIMASATLVANPTTIADFGSINNGLNSMSSSYTLTGTGIVNDVIVTAPTNFQVARGIAGVYANSVTYTATELATAQIVGVRFSPTSGVNGVKSGNITHSGFTGTNVVVSGTETGNTPPNINLFLGTNTSPFFAVANNANINMPGFISLSTQATTFTIQNTGTANLTLGTITFTGTDGANATITSVPTSPVVSNGTTTFNVSYTPTSPGTKTVIFNLPNNDPAKNPYIVTMTFNVVAPLISVSQAATNISNNNTPAYNMGSAVVSNNLDVIFTITNAGNSNLDLGTTTITGVGYSILTPPTTPVAGTNGTTTFTIRFNSASVVSNAVGTVTIPNNTGTANYVVNLLASTTAAPTPTITVSQVTNIANGGTFNMGTTNTNVNNDKIFTITNGGSANLTITSLVISGAGYSIFTQPATSVAFGASNTTTFTVRFNSATAVTNANGVVTITNNTGVDYVINLTATAIVPPAPMIAVSQAATNISNNNTPAYNMGSVITGSNLDVTFTITNAGNSNLTLGTTTITGTGYSIVTPPTTPVAGTNGTTTFIIRFNSATLVSNAVGTVTIPNNTGTANYVINLTATTTLAPAPMIAVSQLTTNITNGGSFNMGNTNTGVNNDKIFTITNGGNANLTLGTTTITGVGYSILTPPTTPVAGTNGTTTFTVRFNSATVVANAGGVVTITNNAGANYVINLTASTTATGSASLTVAPTTLVDFGNVQTNQASITQSYTLSANNLSGNVTVTASTNWGISKDNVVFTNILTYIPSELATPQMVRVRFNPTSNVLGVKSGNITHATAGVTTVNIAVTGTEITPNSLENFSNDFIVSPNPAETFITIKCDAPNRWQKANITFYSIDGKSNSNHTWADATQTLYIDVKSWTRGLYILNIVEGSKIATKKIIVR